MPALSALQLEILAALAGASRDHPAYADTLAGQIGAPEEAVLDAIEQLAAARLIVTMLHTVGGTTRLEVWPTGISPERARLTTPTTKPRKEIDMRTRITAPAAIQPAAAEPVKPRPRRGRRELSDAVIAALAGTSEVWPLSAEAILPQLPLDTDLDTLRKTLMRLAQSGEIVRTVRGSGKRRLALHWLPDGAAPADVAPELATDVSTDVPPSATSEPPRLPPETEWPAGITPRSMPIALPPEPEYMLSDRGELCIVVGDEITRIDRRHVLRLADFLEICYGALSA